MKRNIKGAAQTRTTTNDLAKNMHLRFGIRGRESVEEGASTLTQNALSNPEVYNMTPNVSEEEAKKVREKNERTYLKSALAGGIVEGAVTRSIGSGSPRMVNKLRNIK